MRVQIEKLIYGGAGLARTPDGVVFVPRTAPGDVVEVEVVEQKKDYRTARIVTLLEPSPDRQEPSCPNYETAGCCHWQHIRYERQLDFKEDILRETLWRAGRIDWKEQPIGRHFGPDRQYRMRATFHVVNGRVGFMKEGAHEVVPITECSALVPELNAFISEANELLASPGMFQAREVRAVAGDDGEVAANFVEAAPARGSARRRRETATDEGRVKAVVGGFTFEVHPDAFFQPNRPLAGRFLETVLTEAGEGGGLAADLFCGVGFFSIPLGRRWGRVIGVDSNPFAVRLARHNAASNAAGNAEFHEGDLDRAAAHPDLRPDLVLLDPPRSGCGVREAGRIADWRAPVVVYVSCNPSTFAREAALLIKAGYRLERLTLVDQFPNTYHIEAVARFALE